MVDEKLIERAGQLLLKAAPPGSGVYLFGSQSRRNARPDSDLDFLVVEPELTDQHAEMVRLRDVLRPLRVAADVVVTDQRVFDEWRNTPNNILYEAARQGRALHEVE
ncbi:MAG: nucleotidyltransferase domain-containing protein [Tepidisphaeraceae bacterium]